MRRLAFGAMLLLTPTLHAAEQRVLSEGRPPRFEVVPGPVELTTRCTLAEVAAFDTRVHVKCELFGLYREGGAPGNLTQRVQLYRNELDGNIVYYAVDAQSPLADRVVALAVEAAPADEVTIFFRTNAAENPPGCLPADCRRLTGLVLPIRR